MMIVILKLCFHSNKQIEKKKKKTEKESATMTTKMEKHLELRASTTTH